MSPSRQTYCIHCKSYTGHYTPDSKDKNCPKCGSQLEFITFEQTFDESGKLVYVYNAHGTVTTEPIDIKPTRLKIDI